MSDELPEGWASARLRDGVVAGAQTGFACGKHSRDARGVAHLRPMNVSEAGRLRLDDVKFIDSAEVDRDERWIRSGDVLFNNTNSPELVGKTAVYTEYAPRAFSNHMTRVRCTAAADPHFLAHAIHQKWREGLFASICNNHVSQASISTDVLLDLELPVPPLAEQRRIVAKVEALLEQVRRAKDRLDRVPLILKRFRQAVLAAACEGRLTEEWRREHVEESAAHMLAKALELRRSRQPEAVATARAEGRRKPAEPVSPIPMKEQVADLPDLPDCWSWALLPGLGELGRGRSRHRPRDAKHLYGGLHPFIQTGDIARSEGRITTHSQTYSDAGLAQSRLWPTGTVAITIAANIANSAVLTYPACFPDSVVGFIAEPGLCLPNYVEFFVRTVRERLAEFAPATAQKNINLETLGEVVVALPPLAEQAEIVRRVDGLFALATAIEQRVERAAARAGSLPQAILSKAFAGELVPTEADLARAEGRGYETAEQLLERVQLEARENTTAPQGRRRAARA